MFWSILAIFYVHLFCIDIGSEKNREFVKMILSNLKFKQVKMSFQARLRGIIFAGLVGEWLN